VGTKGDIEKAQWFADIWDRFGYRRGVHLCRVHYQLVSQDPAILKPNGKPRGATLGPGRDKVTYAPKTRAWRFAILGQRTTGALARYLAGRRDTHPELWIGRRGPLAREGMYRAIKHRAAKAGLGKRVHPHLFRKTFATHWLDNNGDPERLRVLAGWSPQTLAQMLEIYVASKRDHLERAHAQAGPVDNLDL